MKKSIRSLICLIIAAALAFSLASCGVGKNEGDPSPSKDDGPSSPISVKPSADVDVPEMGGEEDGDPYVSPDAFGYARDASGSSPEAYGDGGADADGAPSDNEGIPVAAGTLTAGEWKDNDNFDFWRGVLERDEWARHSGAWKMDVSKRFVVTVTNGQTAQKNAHVRVRTSAGETLGAYTDSYGKAYIYYDLRSEGAVPVSYYVSNDAVDEYEMVFVDVTEDQIAAGGISVDVTSSPAFEGNGRYAKLDLMFTTDTTGSMSDELEYLKKELGSVIERVAENNSGLDIRLSVNFYRDEKDDYVVRDFAFSGDIEEVLRQLDEQFSDGGGDYPEAVHTALENSISDHDWREDATKLLFLTLDAPGHVEVEGVPESIRDSISAAASRGIRIIPIAASGVDVETEFLLRAMACVTGGTYIFLTDHSGVGDGHLEPTIGDYNVKKLNDLLVNVINEYCK